MTDPQQQAPKWRTILEGLILATLVWTGTALTTLQAQMAAVQVEVTNLRMQLDGVPELSQRVSRIEGRLSIAERRAEEIR